MYKAQWIFSHTQYYKNLEKRPHADPNALVTPGPRFYPKLPPLAVPGLKHTDLSTIKNKIQKSFRCSRDIRLAVSKT